MIMHSRQQRRQPVIPKARGGGIVGGAVARARGQVRGVQTAARKTAVGGQGQPGAAAGAFAAIARNQQSLGQQVAGARARGSKDPRLGAQQQVGSLQSQVRGRPAGPVMTGVGGPGPGTIQDTARRASLATMPGGRARPAPVAPGGRPPPAAPRGVMRGAAPIAPVRGPAVRPRQQPRRMRPRGGSAGPWG